MAGHVHIWAKNDEIAHDLTRDFDACICGPDIYYPNDDHADTVIHHHPVTKALEADIANLVYEIIKGADVQEALRRRYGPR